MSRPPLARRRIFQGAQRLVRARGARALTLQSLATASGVSRGAILYHWPDRPSLVRFLVQADLAEWERRCAVEAGVDPFATRVLASLDATDDVGMLAASLLPEAREDGGLWDHIEELDRRRFDDFRWDEADVGRYVLLLAAEGAFWRRLNGLQPRVPALDRRVRERVELWLRDAGQAPPRDVATHCPAPVAVNA